MLGSLDEHQFGAMQVLRDRGIRSAPSHRMSRMPRAVDGYIDGAAKSATITAHGTSMEDVHMLIWIGIATAWVACLAGVVVLVVRAPIMDEDADLAERAERIADREAWLKSRKRGAAPRGQSA
jgi:hypothetical protein